MLRKNSMVAAAVGAAAVLTVFVPASAQLVDRTLAPNAPTRASPSPSPRRSAPGRGDAN